MQEVQDLVDEKELPPADPTGSDLSVLSQKRLGADLKPKAAKKAKAKPVAKQRANPNPGPNFKVKKHKKKGSGELADWWYTAAIHDSTKNKQVAQLSCGVADDYWGDPPT
eukprot:s3651_g11.t1